MHQRCHQTRADTVQKYISPERALIHQTHADGIAPHILIVVVLWDCVHRVVNAAHMRRRRAAHRGMQGATRREQILEMSTMKRPPLMFAAIVVVIFMVFLVAIMFWTGVYPGPHLTSSPNPQP